MTMTFMFGFQFKSVYLPWVLIGFNFLVGGFPLLDILGAVGSFPTFPSRSVSLPLSFLSILIARDLS
jgi:hypothetical protein